MTPVKAVLGVILVLVGFDAAAAAQACGPEVAAKSWSSQMCASSGAEVGSFQEMTSASRGKFYSVVDDDQAPEMTHQHGWTSSVAAVPEPTTTAMFLAGLATLFFMGRRRNRS